MFELPLSSNNLRVSHSKFSISGLSQRDVFSSCGLTAYQRQRGREKKYWTLTMPLDVLQRLPPGPVTGSLAASECVSVSSASPFRIGKESGKQLAEKEMRVEAHTLQIWGLTFSKQQPDFQR